MVLEVDEAQVEARFGPFGDRGNLVARQLHGLRQTYHRLSNRFGRTRWYSEVTRHKWKLVSVHLDIVLILTQDRRIVYAERTIGSKIILVTPDETPR
jgi:hypothetical protein